MTSTTHEKVNRRRWISISGAAALLAGGIMATLLAGVATSAHAISAPIHTTATVNMRTGPSTNYAVITQIPQGVSPDFNCWAQGQNISGVDVWFNVNYAGHTGYFASYYDDSSYSTDSAITSKYGIPQCGTSSGSSGGTSGGGTPSSTYVSRTTQVRFCVANASGCYTLGPAVGAGTTASMVCWKDGISYTGDYTTNRWFWVNASNGVTGYLSASVVRNQTAVPACSTNRAVTAADTAASRAGQTYASAADQSLFYAGEWSPGPVGEWAGDCPKLPYVAWYTAGVVIQKRNAIDNYNYYKARGLVHAGNPPVGAVVFFALTSYGHEAVSLGDGLIATTNGMDGQGYANSITSLSAKANYLGWVMPG